MDIKEARYRKLDLEARLAAEIQKHLTAFEEETGQSIQDVSVNMAEVTTMEDRFPKYKVASVSTRLEL